MRLAVTLVLLIATAAPAMAQYCPYGQTCQNQQPVPFPVINPLQGLNNILPKKDNPPPPQPPVAYAPVATPPPVLPPSR